MKKMTWLSVLMVLVLVLGSAAAAHAEIIPPYGEGQIGLQAVVLCEELTMRKSSDAASGVVRKLKYGDFVLVDRQIDGWAHCFDSDSEDSLEGWVNSDYIIVDPARYVTDAKTPVYAWDDTLAPKVALLDANTTLPILKDEGAWLIVSLRGAVGWIRK
ncbi:MAG: hypothetical protein IJ124_06440 [Clostridia bacterium]|nr:hypothetical protein [Clostridia bacterium]